jgi:divalent metal cation (Fe/Co/Zn/Cd) transporter
MAVAAGLVALIVLAATAWFLGDALMLWLEGEGISPPGAAGLTGLAGLVLTGLIALVARWVLRRPHRPALPATTAPGVNGVANGIAADLGALAAQQIVSTSRAHPYGTVGAALAAGLAVGAVPELRKSLMGLLK